MLRGQGWWGDKVKCNQQAYINNIVARVGQRYKEILTNKPYKGRDVDVVGKLYTGQADLYKVGATRGNLKFLRTVKEDMPKLINNCYIYDERTHELLFYSPDLDILFKEVLNLGMHDWKSLKEHKLLF